MKSTLIILVVVGLIGSCDSSSTDNENNTANQVDTVSSIVENNVDELDNAQNDDVIAEEKVVEPTGKKSTDKSKKDKNTVEKKSNKVDSKKVKKATEFTDVPNLNPTNKDFSVDYLMGKFNPGSHKDFTTIKSVHASKGGMHLRKDAYNAFVKMYNAAKKDGVSLKIISATRPFSHQKSIWEAKWQGKRKVNGRFLPGLAKDPEKRALLILQYSSMPGTSRHHWGTDIDLNNLNNSYFESGKGKKIYDWLTLNASQFGFCQVYSPKGDDRFWGYNEEKWHWSYLPVAKQLTKQYKSKIKDEDIKGFEGSEAAVQIEMIDKYVLGINPQCK